MNRKYYLSEERVKVFEDTERLYKSDMELSKAVKESKNATRYYDEDADPMIYRSNRKCNVCVSNFRTYEAAKNAIDRNPGKRVAVLNFASAVTPGGGVKSGASAQEECLCRCSTLLPVLERRYLKDKYYYPNRERNDRRNTDVVIYTPDIVVFKSDEETPSLMDRKDWYKVDVLTCAAPDLRNIDISDEELYHLHINRGRQILKAAGADNVDYLVLGAFGCGAFKNDPEIVAEAYKHLLQDNIYGIEDIEFAIASPNKDSDNYLAFERILSDR